MSNIVTADWEYITPVPEEYATCWDDIFSTTYTQEYNPNYKRVRAFFDEYTFEYALCGISPGCSDDEIEPEIKVEYDGALDEFLDGFKSQNITQERSEEQT